MRQRDEFLEKLLQQTRWLEASANRYDQGDADEAILMAVRLRVLLYDPNSANARSRSLLTHLGVKGTVRLLSTAALMPTGGVALPALTSLSMCIEPPEFVYKPKLDAAQRAEFVSVKAWWSEEVIYGMATAGVDIFRRDIIHWAADKDGGAHVDGDLPLEYQFLESGAGWQINLNPDNAPPSSHTFKHAHFAAIRQMTYEVLNSPELRGLS